MKTIGVIGAALLFVTCGVDTAERVVRTDGYYREDVGLSLIHISEPTRPY